MSQSPLDYRSIIATESERFAELVQAGPSGAAVPGCPEWTLTDLGTHLGTVQRWCTTIVVTGQPGEADYPPPGDDLAGWVRDSTTGLLEALDAASPDDACWTLESPTGKVSFWHRRQALEIAVHRWDADEAVNGSASPMDPVVAADVVDEWVKFRLVRMLGRDGVDLSGLDGDVHFHCTDVAGEWTFEIKDGRVVVVDEHRKSAVAVKGSANDLALFTHRRGDDSGVELFGDQDLMGRWFAAIA